MFWNVVKKFFRGGHFLWKRDVVLIVLVRKSKLSKRPIFIDWGTCFLFTWAAIFKSKTEESWRYFSQEASEGLWYNPISRPPSPKKWPPLKKFLGTFHNISNQIIFFYWHILGLEKFLFEKFKSPITPEILIPQTILLTLKLFRLKRSTKKVSCEFSEKSIFKKFKCRVWNLKKFSSLQIWPRRTTPHGEAGLGVPAGVRAPPGVRSPAGFRNTPKRVEIFY